MRVLGSFNPTFAEELHLVAHPTTRGIGCLMGVLRVA